MSCFHVNIPHIQRNAFILNLNCSYSNQHSLCFSRKYIIPLRQKETCCTNYHSIKRTEFVFKKKLPKTKQSYYTDLETRSKRIYLYTICGKLCKLQKDIYLDQSKLDYNKEYNKPHFSLQIIYCLIKILYWAVTS